jgi:hypothetical protein
MQQILELGDPAKRHRAPAGMQAADSGGTIRTGSSCHWCMEPACRGAFQHSTEMVVYVAAFG